MAEQSPPQPSSTNGTAAETFVKTAALGIGFDQIDGDGFKVLDNICKNMQSEFLMHIHQLLYLSNEQWQVLGVPIGLAAEIKYLLDMKEIKTNQLRKQEKLPSKRLQSLTRKSISFAEKEEETPPSLPKQQKQQQNQSSSRSTCQQQLNQVDANQEEDDSSYFMIVPSSKAVADEAQHQRDSDDIASLSASSKPTGLRHSATDPTTTTPPTRQTSTLISSSSSRSATPPPTTSSRPVGGGGTLEEKVMKTRNSFLEVTSPFDWLMPFDHHKAFKRGMLHGLSGADLKRSVLATSEIWIIVVTLWLGLCIELWSSFPDFEGDAHLGIIGIVYNFAGYFTSIFSVMAMALYSVYFIVSFTISPSKFKSFYCLFLDVYQQAEVYLMVSIYGFFIMCMFYLYGRNQLMFNLNDLQPVDSAIDYNITITIITAAVTFCILSFGLFYNLNILARLAFHCGLMNKNTPSASISSSSSSSAAATKPKTAKSFETDEINKTLQQLMKSSDEVIEMYYTQNDGTSSSSRSSSERPTNKISQSREKNDCTTSANTRSSLGSECIRQTDGQWQNLFFRAGRHSRFAVEGVNESERGKHQQQHPERRNSG